MVHLADLHAASGRSASWSSLAIFPSVRRQRSLASSRIASASFSLAVVCLERLAQEALAEVARLLEVLRRRRRRRARRPPPSVQLAFWSSRPSTRRLTCFVTAPFFEPGRLRQLLVQRRERVADLDRGRARPTRARAGRAGGRRGSRCCGRARGSSSSPRSRASGAISTNRPPDEPARLLEGREQLLLGPVVQAADPEVVVLVEVLLLALGEVVAAPLEAALERGELLVAVDVDPLRLGLDLVLEVVQRPSRAPRCRRR